MTVSAISELLGGRQALGRDIETTSELVALTRSGLPTDVLNTVAGELAIQKVIVAKMLGISERTLSRRMAVNALLTAEESDRMVRLARALALAKETLGDMEKAA